MKYNIKTSTLLFRHEIKTLDKKRAVAPSSSFSKKRLPIGIFYNFPRIFFDGEDNIHKCVFTGCTCSKMSCFDEKRVLEQELEKLNQNTFSVLYYLFKNVFY